LARGGAALLADLLPKLAALAEWTAAAAEAAVRDFAEETGTKLGQVAQPLRAALTGRLTSPGIFDVLAVLGREESLARITDQIATARPALAAAR
jgi:glutamyl-tRNA synthetase